MLKKHNTKLLSVWKLQQHPRPNCIINTSHQRLMIVFLTEHLMSVLTGHCFITKFLFLLKYLIKMDTHIEFFIIVSKHFSTINLI